MESGNFAYLQSPMSLSWPGPLPLTLPPVSLAYSLVEEGMVREDLKVAVFSKLVALMFLLSRLIRSILTLLRQPRLIGNEL